MLADSETQQFFKIKVEIFKKKSVLVFPFYRLFFAENTTLILKKTVNECNYIWAQTELTQKSKIKKINV